MTRRPDGSSFLTGRQAVEQAVEQAAGKNLKQVVYEELKRRIVTCEILPGSMLTEEALCETLNASRTPVRDAVSRLEQENLLSIIPKKGIRVHRVSLNNVEELYVTRLFVEPQLVLTYGNRISDETYCRFLNEFRRTDCTREELYEQDNEFHMIFPKASNNRFILTYYEIMSAQTMRYRILSDQDQRTDVSRKEHSEICIQCLRGNWEQAARAMREHLENSKMSIINYVLQFNRDAHNIFLEKG